MGAPNFNKSARHIHSITQIDEKSAAAQTPAPERFAPGEKADIVIIGGGYTGLSAALHLAEAAKADGRTLNIVLLEAGKVGSAASGKSGGHVGPGFQEHDEAAVAKAFPTPEDGKKALELVGNGPALVRQIIHDRNIDCDLREGYLVCSGKTQTPVMDGTMFGIEPYPYVLGLAEAARGVGVRIYEDTPVRDIVDNGAGGLEIQTSRGSIGAKDMLCAGGHKMAEMVPFLKPLQQKTVEMLATTIVTDPLPQEVLAKIMPSTGGARLPFATDKIDVSYGTVDREGRIIFGAKVGVLKAQPEAIAGKLHELFPQLKQAYRDATGKEMGYETMVRNEPLNLTPDLLPNTGRMGEGGHVRFVHGLGGHGIALGTLLGKAAADDIYGGLTANPALQENFSLMAKVEHMNLPTWKPARLVGAFLASEAVLFPERAQAAVERMKFWK